MNSQLSPSPRLARFVSRSAAFVTTIALLASCNDRKTTASVDSALLRDLTLASAPAAPAQTLLRLDFEAPGDTLPPGWRRNAFPDGASAGLDSAGAYEGRKSLRVGQPTPGRYATLLHVAPAPPLGDATHLRLRAWIRTELQSGTAGLAMGVSGRPYGALASLPDYVGAPPPVVLAFAEMRNRGASGAGGWAPYELTIPAPPGVVEFWLGVRLDGVGTAWFDRFEVAPVDARALAPASPAAGAYVDAALDSMQAYVLDRDRVDWPAFRRRVHAWARGAQTPRDTYAALRAALTSLNRHSFLQSPEQMAAMATGEGPAAGVPEGEMLGRVGYVYVPAFNGWAPPVMDRFAQAAHDVLAREDSAGACGYVVDLRGNTGGNAFPMLAATGPLLFERLDEGPLHYDRGGVRLDDDTMRVRVARPARPRAEAPAAVLIDGQTASSGEMTALRFVGRPHTRTFGAPTFGVTTANEDFVLADGAALFLTRSRMRDRTGRAYGGPLRPDEPVEASEAGALADDPVVRAALAWLGRQPGCAGR